MRLLIYSQDKLIIDDLMENTGYSKGNEVVVSSYLQFVNSLKKYSFTDVILNIQSIRDLKLIKFLNRNYQNVKILLFGDDFINEIVPIIKNSKYKII